jgi:hypothetical protein
VDQEMITSNSQVISQGQVQEMMRSNSSIAVAQLTVTMEMTE